MDKLLACSERLFLIECLSTYTIHIYYFNILPLFCRLIINDKLESGSQLPYIEKAHRRGWGVVVMNTNDKHDCEVGYGLRFYIIK